jgi:peptidylprolyl isomerase
MSLLHRLFCRTAATNSGRRRRSGYWAFPESLERRLAFDVDLAVAIQDGVATYQPGTESVYTVIISNDGPDDAIGVRAVAPLPTGVSSGSWTAQYSPGASGAAAGSSSEAEIFNEFIDLPAGESVILTVTAQIDKNAFADNIFFEVEAVVPFTETDIATTNNTAADTNVRYQPVVVVGSGIGYRSTPTVTVIDPVSGQEVNQFLAFEPRFRGGVSTALADVDEDGSVEIIAASGPGKGEVRVFELDGTELSNFRLRPFGDNYLSGLSLAFGDFDGDGSGDLAVGKSRGADVAVFGLAAGGTGWAAQPTQTFQPYGGSHINGVVLAAADIGVVAGGVIQDATVADGQHELVVGTGAGASRSVQVMSLAGGPTVLGQIAPRAAYGLTGVVVAAARFDSDAIDDIFVSGGRGSSAVTDVFSGLLPAGGNVLQRFSAPADSAGTNARSYASGIDLDGDGQVDQVYSLSGAGSSRGAAVFDRAGSQTNTLEILRGPLHLARSVTPAPVVDQTLITTASGLQYRDLVVGSGAVVTAGQSVTVEYVGSRQNGEVFDSSRGRGSPFNFTLGIGQVIAGWDEGVAGMRVGGRRQLTIPAELAYGDNPSPGGIIQPGDTLVFDVELLSARGSLIPN